MTPRLLLIDNYDSFTYNLVQAFLVLGADVLVHRNDAISVDDARALEPTHVCISPGPGTPRDAGVSMETIRAFAGRVPVLGVCLGHQSLVEVFGGDVVRAGRLMHGKVSMVEHDGRDAQARRDGIGRIKNSFLVLLHVLVVGERQTFEHREQAEIVAENTSRFPSDQLQRVRVLLLRH